MPERNSKPRTPTHGQKTRPPHPTPPSHRPTPSPHRRSRPTKPIKILHRCSSEPILWTVGSIEEDDRRQNQDLLSRPHTYTDVVGSPLRSVSPSTYSFQGYREDSKVVVNVTVEGSPGPVRAMVSLGASVEDMIKLVVDKYSQEGRSPRLDRNAASTFELHHSYFSLEGLNKSDRIGDVGGRSFFLRNSCSSHSSYGERNMVENEDDDGRRDSEVVNSSPPVVLSQLSFIARWIRKIGRRTRKFWKVLGCMACG